MPRISAPHCRRTLFVGVAGAVLAVGTFTGSSGGATSSVSVIEPASLARAQAIRAQVDARYRVLRGHRLAVTEASSTGVVESFVLLTPDFLETRYVSAENGIYYAICPVRSTCPYPPRRLAHPAADLVPRRLALELALRTFLETSADVVAVSLPTPRFIAFIVEREELAHEVDLPALAKALRGDPARALSSSLKGVVDRATRPRVFLAAGLEPTPTGRDSWVGIPRWP
jgi:hypothetical protein